MSVSHSFNFAGGEELSHMGATWFVAYAYYCYSDKEYTAWKKVKTYSSRIAVFNRTGKFHAFWLRQVLLMEDSRLNTNSLKIPARETKRMAFAILKANN